MRTFGTHIRQAGIVGLAGIGGAGYARRHVGPAATSEGAPKEGARVAVSYDTQPRDRLTIPVGSIDVAALGTLHGG